MLFVLLSRTYNVDHEMTFAALTCLPLIDLVGASAHQVSSIPPPQYNSEVRFECNKGLGFEEGVLFKVVRCGEKGFWEPSINFKCTGITRRRILNKEISKRYFEVATHEFFTNQIKRFLVFFSIHFHFSFITEFCL